MGAVDLVEDGIYSGFMQPLHDRGTFACRKPLVRVAQDE